jgi:RNA polymerase sigma-70 factor (ECF subfamily)
MRNRECFQATKRERIKVLPSVLQVEVETGVCARAARAASEEAALVVEILRIAGGNAPALSALYGSTVARLYSLARSVLRCPDDAEEVICDVFLFVWHNARRYDPQRGSVMGWLLIIVRSRSIDRLRKRQTSVSAHDGMVSSRERSSALAAETPEEILRHFETNSRVTGALALQSPVRRSLIILAFFEGLCHEEIAEATGLPLGTVKSHIRRTLKSMRKTLDIDSAHAGVRVKPAS